MNILNFMIIFFLLFNIKYTLSNHITKDATNLANDLNSNVVLQNANNFNANKEVSEIYKGENVPETNYYHSGLNIENEAKKKSLTNKHAKIYNKAIENNKDYKFDRDKDPIFKRYDKINEQSHKLSETYSDCVEIPVGTKDITKHKHETCHLIGNRKVTKYNCQKELAYTCQNSNAGHPHPVQTHEIQVLGDYLPLKGDGYDFSFGPVIRNAPNCTKYTNDIKLHYSRNTHRNVYITQIRYDDGIFIKVNGAYVFKALGPHTGLHLKKVNNCEYGWVYVYGHINLVPYLKEGLNTIHLEHYVARGGQLTMDMRIERFNKCVTQKQISYKCPSGESIHSGTKYSSKCTEGPASKNIRGTQVYSECWKWDEAYQRIHPPYYTPEKKCTDLVKKGCGKISIKCVSQADYCTKKEALYSCPYLKPAQHVSMCGDTLICPNGDCTKDHKNRKKRDATQDFLRATSNFALLKELKDQMKESAISIFKGKVLKCKKKKDLGNYKDCCSDKGWGTDIGITKCSNEEEELILARQAGQTIHVGNYKTGSWPNKSKYEVFCSYPSKIARIIMGQVRPWLNKNFGTANHPDCSGITTEELKKIDMGKIDLSEFYTDAAKIGEKVKVPNVDHIANKIKDKVSKKSGKRHD